MRGPVPSKNMQTPLPLPLSFATISTPTVMNRIKNQFFNLYYSSYRENSSKIDSF